MAIGVSTSIAGIFCALSLFVFIGIARRSFDRLLRHARHHRYQWIPLFDSGVAGVTAALETLPVAVANEVQRALEGVGDRMAVSMAVALSPLTKVVDKFEAELANQTNALLVWIDQQEAVTTAARVAYEGLAAAATRSESAAEENAKRFAKLVVALEANASEVQQFRDGFEDLISNLEALAKNYREAGQQFGVVVGALGHIEAHHGELGSGIQSLNGAVVLMGDQLGRQADVFNETTVESVQQLGEINRQLAATTEQSASSMVQAVDGAMRNIARTSAETSGEVVRQIGPTIARDIAKSVSELVVRQPWYSRIFPFFRDV
jgi:ABC-type transporter Mla subunit MlaD